MFGAKLVLLKDNSKNMKLLFQGGHPTGKSGKPGINREFQQPEKSLKFRYITGKIEFFFNCNDSSCVYAIR